MSLSLRTIIQDKFVHTSLGLKLNEGVTQKLTIDKKALGLGKPHIIQHSGKEDAEPSDKLGQGRIYELNFGSLNSQRDAVLVSVNPALSKTCVVAQSNVLAAKESQELSISVYTIKQTDISELDWIVRLYVLS